MSLLRRIGIAAEVLICGTPAERPVGDRVRARVPKRNPLKSKQGHAARTEAAMTLMDDDVYGFLLLTVHKDAHGPDAHIRIQDYLDTNLWPAVGKTCDRIALAERMT